MLSAIAVELERDEAERLRSAQQRGGSGGRGAVSEPVAGQVPDGQGPVTGKVPAAGPVRGADQPPVAGKVPAAGPVRGAGQPPVAGQPAVAGEVPVAGLGAGAAPADDPAPDDGAAVVGGAPADDAAPDDGAAMVGVADGADPADGAGVVGGAAVADGGALPDGVAPENGATELDGARLADSEASADSAAPAGTDSPDGAALADAASEADSAASVERPAVVDGPADVDGPPAAGGAALANGPTLAYGWVDAAAVAAGPALANGPTFAYGWVDHAAAPDDEAPVDGPAQTGGAGTTDTATSGDDASQTVAPEPEGVPKREMAAEAADPGEAAAPWPAVPRPRKAPGTNSGPPPLGQLPGEHWPPSPFERQLAPEAHTEPIPKISGHRRGDFAPPQGARPEAAGALAPSWFQALPADPAPAGAAHTGAQAPQAVPAQSAPAPGAVRPGAVPAQAGPAEAEVAVAGVAEAGVAEAGAAGTESAGSVPPVTAAASAGPPWAAAPPAGPRSAAATPPTGTAPPGSPTAATPSSAGPPDLYRWTARPGGTRPGGGGAGGPMEAWPAVPPPPRRQRRSGRRYRVAGVVLAVLVLVAAAAIALVLSGHAPKAGHSTGSGPSGPAAVRNRAAAWVAGQVSRAAVVACDPVTCQALRSHNVPASSLYQLGPQTASPLRSQVIVATAAVRKQFGDKLGLVYAPGVLASFGAGPDRIDIRQTAPHGAASFRAMLLADVAVRKASGKALAHSSRIAATFAARRQLAAGQVDQRLLIAIARMAVTHPMYIVDFGRPAPGAGAGMPLRQADLSEDAHTHHHPGRIASPGYVRFMVSLLRALRGQYRPAYVRTLHLPEGAVVLRIEFTAPSPMGLLSPHA